MKKQKTFRYTIELSEPMFPRYIADIMTTSGNFARTLLSVTDQQNDQHWYGDTGCAQSATYMVQDGTEPLQVIMEDAPLHNADMQCDDTSCPCHEEEWSNIDDAFTVVSEDTEFDYRCIECGRQYCWSADDISWEYEKPFMPCGHPWHSLQYLGQWVFK